LLLYGVRASMRTLPPATEQLKLLQTRKREHSRKPDEQYTIIEACSPGPYLEVFARYPRAGWHVWGAEAQPDVAPRGQIHAAYRGGPIEPD
jgi:N6-adenosine-specific RNA methylase IME4